MRKRAPWYATGLVWAVAGGALHAVHNVPDACAFTQLEAHIVAAAACTSALILAVFR